MTGYFRGMFASGNIGQTSGVFSDSTPNMNISASAGSGAGANTVNFNASRVVNTGDEVMPRNVSQLLYFRTF